MIDLRFELDSAALRPYSRPLTLLVSMCAVSKTELGDFVRLCLSAKIRASCHPSVHSEER